MKNTAKPIQFSPGAALDKFLAGFAKKNGLKNKQEALRQITRERMIADQQQAQAS